MYQSIHDVTIESLKKHATMIHYFGLGFIQIKLGPRYRIHFYTKLLPAIISEEEVHNHRYDFTSTILAGTFTQKIYSITSGNTHIVEDESCTEHKPQIHQDTVPDSASHYCGITLLSEETYSCGSHYTISADTYHTVHTTNAVTLLDRKPHTKEFAQVVKPKNHPPTCPFSKKIDEEELWKIVEEILARYKK